MMLDPYHIDVAALSADLASAEAEWARLDSQADKSAAVKSALLVERMRRLRAAIAQAERDGNAAGGPA